MKPRLTQKERDALKARKQFNRAVEPQSKKVQMDCLKFNLFLIREMTHLLSVKKKSSAKTLYLYLFADKYTSKITDKTQLNDILYKCQDKFQHVLYNDFTNIDSVLEKLDACGISSNLIKKTYFNTNKTIANAIHIRIKTYEDENINDNDMEDDEIGFLAAFRETLLDSYETILNFDGTPLVESIYTLINRATLYVSNLTNKQFFNYIDKIPFILSNNFYTEKTIKQIYSELIEKNSIDKLNNLDLSAFKEGSTKNIYYAVSKENIKINYFLIKEILKLFASIDDVGNILEKYYSFLDVDEEEYDNMVQKGMADNKKLSQKLCPYLFPINMFRSDKPALLPMNSKLYEEVQKYIGAKNTDSFQEFLKIHLLYISYPENLMLLLSTYYLFKDIVLDEKSVYYDWEDFAVNHPELVFKDFPNSSK